MATNKGFIKDWFGNYVLPITRGELVLDSQGQIALRSSEFLADLNSDGLPGLMTAAEKRMLSGGGSGGIQDIYTKLGYINSGFQVKGSTLNFYNAEGTKTPINFNSLGEGSISITVGENNQVNFNLSEVTTETTISQIIKSIAVDKFGRVTSVTGSALTNAEIPNLEGKKITNSSVDGCSTENEAIDETNTKAIANKAYVDKRINEITGLATGALKFGGPMDSLVTAQTALANSKYYNHYYKVTKPFDIPASDMYSETEGSYLVHVKPGDTLIIYPTVIEGTKVGKFVYVPSGDDRTRLTVKEEGQTDALSWVEGDVTLQFSQVFEVVDGGNQIAKISIPQANSSQDGYLSKSDWIRFNGYQTGLAVSYLGEITSTSVDGAYKIGTLTIGGTDNIIYGKNNISVLSLKDNTESTGYNPILEFVETGVDAVSIVFKGVNGIVAKKNGDTIEIGAANEVDTDSSKYLEITNGYKFGVKIGSLVTDGNTTRVQDGLTDFSDFATFRANVLASTTSYELINNSLSDTSKTYYYGSTSLVGAIDFESYETT